MFFMLMEESHNTIVEYGPMKMALELRDRNILTQFDYECLSNLSISDKHKSLVLFNYIMHAITTRTTDEELHAFLNNDRKLWNLSIRMRQTC